MSKSTVLAQAGKAPRRNARPVIRAPWWFILPAAAFYIFASVSPNVQAMLYSLTDWNGRSADFSFVGLQNFADAFARPQFVGGLRNTLLLTLVGTLITLILALLLALALNTQIKSRNALRVVFFAPVVLTSVAVGYIWKYLYAPTGVLNEILEFVGLPFLKHDWLGDPAVNLYAIAFICAWQGIGVTMVIFLAGLQGIDSEVIEASHIDGASSWQRFWFVIRPLLGPAIFINTVLCVMNGLRTFDQIFVTTGGGPAYTTSTLATLTYTDGFLKFNYNYGVTLSVILAVLVAAVTTIQFRLMRQREQ
jgi:raffinose/stachyose/melibiose transport system permease protein